MGNLLKVLTCPMESRHAPANPLDEENIVLLTKTLLVTEALLIQVPSIKNSMGEAWPSFHAHLLTLKECLLKGPNPDFTPPLMAALHISFQTPAEPIILAILQNHGFDYRFITGQPRRFSALKPSKAIPEPVQRLWQKTIEASQSLETV